MLRKIYYPIILSALVGSVAGCNSSDDTEYTYTESASVLVSGFSLTNDSKVLDSLQNVFFSIDLVNFKIFNADSMPYGTNVTHLIPKITAPSTASEVSLKFFSTETRRDSIVDYLTNSTDSIDFSHGPVILTVKSQNGTTGKYEIRVNVHQVKADSLAWYKLENAHLPSDFGSIKSQNVARCGNKFYCLTSDGTAYSLAVAANPSDEWDIKHVAFPFSPNIESMRSTDTEFYMLSNDGELFTSKDFTSWISTGEKWHYIYGAYNDQIVGSKMDAYGYSVAMYPSGKLTEIPAGFPIEGTTLPACYDTPMGGNTQLVMLGGRTADGALVKDAWSFDGNSWANVTSRPIDAALEGMTLVPYHLVDVPSTTWVPVSYPVLLALGGRDTEGKISRTVYYSRDWGMTWKKAPALVQMPEEMPSFYGASAFEYSDLMHVQSRSAKWHEVALHALPAGASFITNVPKSRATAPITQWECPTIFLFGGKDSQGITIDNMWRGVISQFTFMPVQ